MVRAPTTAANGWVCVRVTSGAGKIRMSIVCHFARGETGGRDTSSEAVSDRHTPVSNNNNLSAVHVLALTIDAESLKPSDPTGEGRKAAFRASLARDNTTRRSFLASIYGQHVWEEDAQQHERWEQRNTSHVPLVREGRCSDCCHFRDSPSTTRCVMCHRIHLEAAACESGAYVRNISAQMAEGLALGKTQGRLHAC